MLERITSGDPIWNDPPYLSDEVLFNLMPRLRQAENGLFLTDRKSILLAQTSEEMPAWVWTADGLKADALAPLKEACEAYGIVKITVKPDVMSRLFTDKKVVKRLTAHHCPSLSLPRNVDGEPIAANGAHVDTIAELLVGYVRQAEGIDRPAFEYRKDAQALASNPGFQLWRTSDGTVAACALLSRRTERHGCINHVSTLPALRGRGYAGAVVAAICKQLASEGLIPMLYADTDYLSSNRAYQKIGFIPVGNVVTVALI